MQWSMMESTALEAMRYAHAVRVEEAGRAAVNGVYMLSNQLDSVKILSH